MLNNPVRSMLLVGATLIAAAGAAQAAYPEDQVIDFLIHETPEDPESDVILTVRVELTAADWDGDWVAWEPVSYEFRKPGEPNDIVWVEEFPEWEVNDPYGQWWIEHEDPLAPDVAEFADFPRIDGTARAAEPTESDLEYDFEGDEYTSGRPPYTVTASVNAYMIEVGAVFAMVEDEDEPTEVKTDGDVG